MAVTANQTLRRRDGNRANYLAAAATYFYAATLAFINEAGYLVSIVNSGVNKFAGLVVKEVDNSAGAAGDLNVEVMVDRDVVLLTGTGFTQATVGRKIYATDNYTITTNPTNAVYIGRCVEYYSTTQVYVQIVAHDQANQVTLTPDDSESVLNQIPPSATMVSVGAAVNGANDFIVLPSLADVPIGHEITVVGNAGSNFEVRTPDWSAEEINSEDCDGTKEYLFTDTQIVKFVKISDTVGWMGHGFSALGAVVTAVVPD